MNRHGGRARRRPADRGAAAVEMALVLPLLLFLVFGIVDFGRMLNAQIVLTEAAREGARAEALHQSPGTRVTDATPNLKGTASTVPQCQSSGGDPPLCWAYQNPTSSPGKCPDPPGADDDAGIQTRYTFTFVTPIYGIAVLFGGNIGGDVKLTGEGVMPCIA